MAEQDLTTIDGLLDLIQAVADFDERWLKEQKYGNENAASAPTIEPAEDVVIGEFNGTYCGRCAGIRRMELTAASSRCDRLNPRRIAGNRRTLETLRPGADALAFSVGAPPPVFVATCLQCRTVMSLVVDAALSVNVRRDAHHRGIYEP